MNQDIIRKLIEDGFAIKRIAGIVKEKEKDIKNIVLSNNFYLKKEQFNESKIDYICELYKQGVSAKSLGIKFNIDKRRIQKWVDQRGLLRNNNDSKRFTDFNQNMFDDIDSPAKAYWLGFFYADAYNHPPTNTASVTLSTKDQDHLIKLAKFASISEEKIHFGKSKSGHDYCGLRFYSKHLCEMLIQKGCPQAKSFIIKYPEWLPNSLHNHFIRGMFDGDGSLPHSTNNKSYRWSLVSTLESCGSIQNIFFKNLNFIVNFHCISKTNNNTYELEQSGNEKVFSIMNWLYGGADSSIYLQRKYDRFLLIKDGLDSRTFTRKAYKVTDTEKISIQNDLEKGEKVGDLAVKYNIHPRTIRNIKYNPIGKISKYESIISIDGKILTAPYVKTLSEKERELLIDPIFNKFRNDGWTYPDDDFNLINNWENLCEYTPDIKKTELNNNSSLGTKICKHFCHDFFKSCENGNISQYEAFHDDKILKAVIKNRLGLGWKNTKNETFNISFKTLMHGMRVSRLASNISIFKPSIAKYMYLKYSNENDIVYDYSAGWGGRMLGAASCKRRYIGVDPLTIGSLERMVEHLNISNINLISGISENVMLEKDTIDFSFSSPPFFNQEIYSDIDSQAYNKGEDYFYNVYWRNTLQHTQNALKPNKWFGLNVKNYPKMLQMAIEIFGDIQETVNLKSTKHHTNRADGVNKYEPIYMFKNCK